MSQPPIPRPPGSRGAVVTPVEERIDHEEAKRIFELGSVATWTQLRHAVAILLTEHSARESEKGDKK